LPGHQIKEGEKMVVRCSILLFLSLCLFLVACNRSPLVTEEGSLQVVSTVSPITNIIHNIGGDRIRLSGIVPEGVNSHTFEPVPSDATKLAQADLIFINGLQLEQPTLELAEANLKEGAEIVQLGELTITPAEYVFDFSFPREAGSPNPHLWTNPIYALKYAEIVRDRLAARDPDNGDYYRANYESFGERIMALDEAIKATTATIPEQNRKLLTYHDSFAYFAPRYGYEVIGAIQPADFSEPSAQEMARLIQQVQEEQVPAIFGSEVFPSPVLEQIGREADVRYIDTLRDDDLPGEVGSEDHSYIGLMLYDLRIMAEALGGDPSALDGVDASNVSGPDSAVQQQQ
jgi:ABC-type Zn uptake system ZnuABC Zn-binding protein ZnuA